ncbi:MAG: 16S rRNA (guanine(527)-N(7))-methyltransferase, partial [uncultured Nocardioides sp.]
PAGRPGDARGTPPASYDVPGGGRGRAGAHPRRGRPGPRRDASRRADLRCRHLSRRRPPRAAAAVVHAARGTRWRARRDEGELGPGRDRGRPRDPDVAGVRGAGSDGAGGPVAGSTDHGRPGGLGRSGAGRLDSRARSHGTSTRPPSPSLV